MAICKSWNGESWNGMRGMMGMQGIKVGMQRIRVGMMEIRGIRVGMRGIGVGNDGNKGENFRIGVELTNYNRGEGQK